MEGIGFRDRIQEFEALRVPILGVSTDPVEANAAFAARYGFPFPLLSDTTREICMAYGACDHLDDAQARRVTYIVGPNGRVLQRIDDMNAQEHPVAALRYLYGVGGAVAPPVGSLVYALGRIGYDFGTDERRDQLARMMRPASPHAPINMLRYLDDNPDDADKLVWILSQSDVPIYALRPDPAFAEEAYGEFRQFLSDQIVEGVEHISVPGVVRGSVTLVSGQVVPLLEPAVYGMFSWTTDALVRAVQGDDAAPEVLSLTRSYLERVYYGLRNLGRTSKERALNYAATNALQAGLVAQQVAGERMALYQIDTEPSPICRPDADCWDIVLTFFDPGNRLRRARKVYRFTIDVGGLIPVSVGTTRSWYVNA